MMCCMAILTVETVAKGDKKHTPTKTNKTWIRMRIRDYMNGLVNVKLQIGLATWDDIGCYQMKVGKDGKDSINFWLDSIGVLNAMVNQWTNLITMNNWVGSPDKSVIVDLNQWIKDAREMTLSKADKAKKAKAMKVLVTDMERIMAEMNAIEMGETTE